MDTLNGATVEEFSLQTFNTWGLGQKDLNNGVLLTVALKEKMLRIEVGTGLKAKISKLVSSKMISDIIPYFKKGNIDAGVIKAVNDIDKAVKGKYRIIANKGKLNRTIKYNLLLSITVYGVILALSYRIGQYLRAVTISLIAGSGFGTWLFMKILTRNISLIEFSAKLYNTMIGLIIIGTPIIILLAVIITSCAFTKGNKNTTAIKTIYNDPTLANMEPKSYLNLTLIFLIIPTSLMLGMIMTMIVFYDVTPAIIASDIYDTIINFFKASLAWLGLTFVCGVIAIIKDFFFPNGAKAKDTKVNEINFLGEGGTSDGEAGSTGSWGWGSRGDED